MLLLLVFMFILRHTVSDLGHDWSANKNIPKRAGYRIKEELVRRTGILALSSLALIETNRLTKANAADSVFNMQIDTAAKIINQHCQVTLSAVKNTGRLIYRGEETSESKPLLYISKSDLLAADTYNPTAANFFEFCSEAMEKSELPISPRRGHLATSDQAQASQWGPICSIWPIDTMHYAWLLKDNQWWNDEWATPQGTTKII